MIFNELMRDDKGSTYGKEGHSAETGSVLHPVSYPMSNAVKAVGGVKQITHKRSNQYT
jgi:hypothetical protein